MVVVPADTPLTAPPVPTVATVVLLLLHVPPAVASVNEVILPAHTARVPVMGAGENVTNTVVVVMQPVGKV